MYSVSSETGSIRASYGMETQYSQYSLSPWAGVNPFYFSRRIALFETLFLPAGECLTKLRCLEEKNLYLTIVYHKANFSSNWIGQNSFHRQKSEKTVKIQLDVGQVIYTNLGFKKLCACLHILLQSRGAVWDICTGSQIVTSEITTRLQRLWMIIWILTKRAWN